MTFFEKFIAVVLLFAGLIILTNVGVKICRTLKPTEESVPVIPQMTLKKVYSDAHKEGKEIGISIGRVEGVNVGFIEGKEVGLIIGRRDGFKEGFVSGYRLGLEVAR